MDETPVDIDMMNVQDIEVATVWIGPDTSNQPPLVWIHGLGGSSTIAFAGVASALERSGRRSLLIDLPGHGHSDAPGEWTYTIEAMADLVMEIVTSLVDKPVMLVGHSMGGSVAIACAHRFPISIGQLIVAEPNLDPDRGTISPRIARQDEGRFVTQGYPALLRTTRTLADRGDLESRDWLRTLEMASPVALHRCSISLQAKRFPTLAEQFAALAMPVATIRGERSSFGNPVGEHKLQGYVVAGAGHQMIAGNPRAFVEILDHILQRA